MRLPRDIFAVHTCAMTSQRLAVVTGGSSGIGAATAAALAGQGWKVVAVARGAETLQSLAQRLVAAGGDVVARPVDASDGEEVDRMAAHVLATHGAPDAIVNAAGAGEWRFIEDTPSGLAVSMMGAPYFAAFNVTSAFMASMLQRRRGVIIHVGSPASIVPWPGATAYAATRWALRGLHEALRQDLRGTGVTSCHVVFGEVSSPYFETNAVPRDELPRLGRWLPVTTPRECAEVIVRTIARPQPQVLHPPVLRTLMAATKLAPPLGRRLVAWGAPRH